MFTPGAAFASPAQDGGGFPTETPTATPLPTETPAPTETATQQTIVLTLEIPTATSTEFSLNPEQPSNILAGTPTPEDTGRNPLISLAYVVLFIFIVVGVWILFTRGNQRP